MSEGVDV